ncbi:MAG: type IV secretion protein Rhs [Caldilineaceae bacterium]|nr:type IV secretion protein Rhs [Caldilineaceae bacterium]
MSPIVAIPPLTVVVNGSALPGEQTAFLGEVTVRQQLSLPTQCELAFFDPPETLDAGARFRPGTALELSVAGHQELLFAGEVTAVEHLYGPGHEQEVRVRGYDLLHRLRKHQDVRAHVQISAYELARELAARLGLAVHAVEQGPTWQRLYQHQQSDLALLADVAARGGLYLTLREDGLHLVTLDGSGPELPLALGESLLEARVEVNADPACRTVTATGWDPLRVETHSGRATAARTGRTVVADAAPARVGSDGHRQLVNEPTPTDDHAAALAQAELDRRTAGEVTFWGVAEGDPRLRPGARVRVEGLERSLNGRYVLTEVTHRVDSEMGFVSELSSTPPAPTTRAKSAVSTLGIVTAVDDPEQLGRIRVALPAYGNVETEWLGMLGIGAGKGKGLVILPDVGDRVLVLLLHEDPGLGIILGGLYGMEGPPDSGVEGGSVRRYTLRTPGGQRVQLDDSNNSARIENQDGSYVELAPGTVRIHAATDLEIEAPGRSITIRGASIDFERG